MRRLKPMAEEEPQPKPTGSGWGYLTGVTCFCAPSFLFYGFGALDILTGKGAFVALALVAAAASPFAFGVAVAIGLLGMLRPAWWQIRLAIVCVLLIALKIQIGFSSRPHY